MKFRYFQQQNEMPTSMKIVDFANEYGCSKRQAQKYLLNKTPLKLQYSIEEDVGDDQGFIDVPIVIEIRKEAVYEGQREMARFL